MDLFIYTLNGHNLSFLNLGYDHSPIINNLIWTIDNPIDIEVPFKAIYSIYHYFQVVSIGIPYGQNHKKSF